MKNSLRIHKWTHNEFNIFILGVLTHPRDILINSYSNSQTFALQVIHYLLTLYSFLCKRIVYINKNSEISSEIR